MKYITNNELLTAYIPNVVTAVEGEKDLFTKITPHLTMAEAWLEANVVKYEDIASNESAMTYAKIIVANEGFRKAIPSLDLILTQNGFGIVSDNNIAPASRDRVNALLAGVQATVDESIEALDTILNGAVLGGTVFKGYAAQRQQELMLVFLHSVFFGITLDRTAMKLQDPVALIECLHVKIIRLFFCLRHSGHEQYSSFIALPINSKQLEH